MIFPISSIDPASSSTASPPRHPGHHVLRREGLGVGASGEELADVGGKGLLVDLGDAVFEAFWNVAGIGFEWTMGKQWKDPALLVGKLWNYGKPWENFGKLQHFQWQNYERTMEHQHFLV